VGKHFGYCRLHFYKETGSAVSETESAVTETESAVTEIGSAVTEIGSAATETGSVVTEMESAATEIESVATETGSAVTETGSAVSETGTAVSETRSAVSEIESVVIEKAFHVSSITAVFCATLLTIVKTINILRVFTTISQDLKLEKGKMDRELKTIKNQLHPKACKTLLMKNIILFLLLQFSVFAFAQPGSLDTSFNPGTGANADVSAIAVQGDGKIIIGGYFTNYNGTTRNYIARLNADGSLDTGFDLGSGSNGIILSTAIQSDGKIIIGGQFTSYNGTAIKRIARLNADGSLDTGFNPGSGTDKSVRTTLIQPDGKIVIGGQFNSCNGMSRNHIARLNIDGSLDTSFTPGTGANSDINTLALQSDGKIIIGGFFTKYNSNNVNFIARLNTDGSSDTAFNLGTGANSGINAISVQPDGKIIIGGGFTSYNGTGRKHIARLNADGSLDMTFDPGSGSGSGLGLGGEVLTTLLQPDGKITIGGTFKDYNGTARNYIARLKTDGSLDMSFDSAVGSNAPISTTLIQPDGKIIIGGNLTTYNNIPRNKIARLNGDPMSPTASPQAFCSSATLTDLVATGMNLKWYASAIGGSVLSPTTPLNTGTYYVSQTLDGYESGRTAVQVTINTPVLPVFTQVNPVCFGTAIPLSNTSDNGVVGTWSPAFDNTKTTPYTFAPSAESCGTSATMTVEVLALPDLDSDSNNIICSDGKGEVILDAGLHSGMKSDYSYQWSKDGQPLTPDQDYDPTATSAGVYTCTVTNKKTGCKNTRTDTVEYSESVAVTKVAISDLTEHNSVTVTVSGNPQYSLDNPTGPFLDSNVFINVEPGIHTVYVNDKKGCGQDSREIAVMGAPSYFTPNGDSYNDTWKLKGANAVFNKNTKVSIFDRYSKLLKELPNAETDGWDGTFNDYPMPADDYWFEVKMEDGRVARGHFALKR